jgi:pilus assembly protein CpaC
MTTPFARLRLALAAIAAVAAFSTPVLAQIEQPDAGLRGAGVIRVDLAGQSGVAKQINIPKGRSAMVELPVDARDVVVANPAVADAVLRTPRHITILGVNPGQTDAAFFDASGRRILALSIRVDADYSAAVQAIARVIPGAQIHVESVNNSLILSGQVANATDADHAVQIAAQYTGRPDAVINLLTIAGKEQVMLKVKIVEVQRSVIKQLGFNLAATLGQIGSPQYMISSAATWAVNGSLLGGGSGTYQMNTTQQPEVKAYDPLTGAYDLPEVCRTCNTATTQTTSGSRGLNTASAMLQAFEQVGLVRTLAEPNLTAVSGEAAKFLAGGSFPVPTGEDSTGKVSVSFQSYGVGLGFTPVVLSGGRISLKISTEVSELTNQGAFTLSAGSGSSLTVPGLNVRRAETTVELPSGGAMMIAGLLEEETKQDLDSMPGLMNLPVLGALFRSRDYQSGETELMIIVTPYIVQPTNPANLQTPADGLQVAGDLETNLLGHLNKVYKAPPEAVAGRTYKGPVGYVID